MNGKKVNVPNFTMNEVQTPKEIKKAKKNPMDRIMSYWETPEGKKTLNEYFEREKQKRKLFEHQTERVFKYWKSLKKKEKKELLNKFLLWETAYEDMWYMERHAQTTSRLWSIVTAIIRNNGKDVTKKYDEDFLGSAYSYKKYVLKTYCGQGCFDRLYLNDEEIFQTT